MGKIQYYLVNHTRKEFCWFNAKRSLYEELDDLFAKYTQWSRTEMIRIEGEEESKSPDLWDHLTQNLCYLDLNYHEHSCN
jgi:hypothetical protein